MIHSALAIFAFRDDDSFARAAGRHFHLRPRLIAERHFPFGELSVRLDGAVPTRALVATTISEDPRTLFRALVVAYALREAGTSRVDLVAPWIAYGRQDRHMPDGTGAGLALAGLLAEAFDHIVTLDAHSPSFRTAFQGHLINVLPEPRIEGRAPTLMIAPDEGSRERTAHAALAARVPFLVMKKIRTRTGAKCTFASAPERAAVRASHALIIDDMADSGDTLLAAARSIHDAGASSAQAFVTHAFDLHRLRSRLRAHATSVQAAMDHRTGTIEPAHCSRLFSSIPV